RAGRALAKLARHYPDDPYLTAAVLSSVNRTNVADVLSGVLESGSQKSPPEQLAQKLVAVATELGDESNLVRIFASITKRPSDHYQPSQMAALAGVLKALARQRKSLDKLAGSEQLNPMLPESPTV